MAQREQLGSILKGKWKLVSAPPLVERARMVKDKEEIRHIRAAIELGASLFKVARRTIRPGVREVEVAAAMEYTARKGGADGMSFSTIIAAGKRSAVVHGRASAARIPRRGFVVCDFGVILSGYCSDMTRTLHVGRPSADAQGVYDAVREAQQAALDAVKPGNTVGDIGYAIQTHAEKNRYGVVRDFCGHGLGQLFHDAPEIVHAGRPGSNTD